MQTSHASFAAVARRGWSLLALPLLASLALGGPARAEELGRPFAPEESGYAGLENPVGKRFRGIVRWAAPVEKGGRIVGYVTLALNHDPANVQALRRLFLEELPGARDEVLSSARRGDAGALRSRLHRLQAGCGLVGARRLGAAVELLRRTPESMTALDRFDHAARDLLR